MVAELAIPAEVLAEQYFGFMQDLISKIQHRFRFVGLTQKNIAARLKRQPAVISRWLSGQENMTVRTMHDLARAMDCRLEINLVPLDQVRPSNRPIAKKLSMPTTSALSPTMPLEFNVGFSALNSTSTMTFTK